MRRMHGGLVAAMENEELKTDDDNKEMPDHADSLETDVAEVNNDAAEGEAHQADTDEAEATSEALESFRVAIGGMQADGGIEPKGAFILHLATEHLLNRVGSSGASLAIPAMESFGGTGSRIQAGSLAMEALSEEIQKIWRAIVEAIKKAAAWVVGYWNKIFGAAENLQKRAKALEEAARAATGTPKSADIDDSGLAAKLVTGGTSGSEGGSVAALAELKTVTTAIVSRGAAITSGLGKKAVEAVAALDKKNLPEILKLCEAIPGSTKIANPQAAGVAAGADGIEVWGTTNLPGNYAVVSWVPSASKASVTEQVKQLQGVAYKTVQVNKGAKAGAKLPTLKQNEAIAIAKTVGEIATELLSYRKNSGALAQAQKDLAAAAESVAGKAGGEEDEGKREDLAATKAIATAANRIFLEPGASFSKYCVEACQAYLHYIEKSIKQYGKAA